ncbi:TPA: hypothetical protein OQV14_004385, partial [Shigella flexneri]|nr:hypothetical protein [Shigella flexneri]
ATDDANRTGGELCRVGEPGTETGEPFGSPTQPAINRECDCANDMKKDAGASHIAP